MLLYLFQAQAQAEILTGLVIRVSDGDTLVILDSNKVQHKIRLQGIDALELGQAYGRKSLKHLSERTAGRFVIVEYIKRDRYMRIVGKVLLGKQDINLGWSAGHAWHYRKYQDEQTRSDRINYADAEREARNGRKGLWHDTNPVSP